MTSHNDITGDAIKTGSVTDDYRSGWDRIFGKKKDEPVFHLRSYGDVSAEDLKAYAERRTGPDAHCHTEADGSCSSTDPCCMHQPKENEDGEETRFGGTD